MLNLEQNYFNHKGVQIDTTTKSKESSSDSERASKLIERLNIKYPHAKLIVEYVGNKEYSVGGARIKEKDLEKKFKITNEIYKPLENEKWYDK